MAIPRVFVSSTCYDLRYIRENVKFFIKSMGFDPVLSEEGSVFYDPTVHVQDACLAEVPNCQMFVLIIGGRFGSKYKNKPESIVNQEYREATEKKIPVFAMVEQQVYAEYRVYQKNKENKEIDASKISYPGVDSTKIFDFMEEVQGKSVNNALVPFADINELESYLKQQWAGMMFSFLTRKSESERMASALEALSAVSSKIEFLSKQILSSVGQEPEKLNVTLYENVAHALTQERNLNWLSGEAGFSITPAQVVKAKDLTKFLEGNSFKVKQEKPSNQLSFVHIARGNRSLNIGDLYFRKIEKEYVYIRKELVETLAKNGMTAENYIKTLEGARAT